MKRSFKQSKEYVLKPADNCTKDNELLYAQVVTVNYPIDTTKMPKSEIEVYANPENCANEITATLVGLVRDELIDRKLMKQVTVTLTIDYVYE